MNCPFCHKEDFEVCNTDYNEYTKVTVITFVCNSCGKDWIETIEDN